MGLRNTVHSRLSVTHGPSWFHDTSVLRRRELETAQRARDRVIQTGKPVTPGRIVAELSLGFWVGLFANVYDSSIWRTDLYRLFLPLPPRSELHDDLDRLRTLRNRIAHHEPITQRRLLDDYTRVRRVTRSFSPELCAWMEFHSRVLDILAQGPESVERF